MHGETDEEAIIRSGRSAFLNNRCITDNPHPKGSPERRAWSNAYVEMQVLHGSFPIGEYCHATRDDGDCDWKDCPQLRDDEPKKTHRHCPLDRRLDDD